MSTLTYTSTAHLDGGGAQDKLKADFPLGRHRLVGCRVIVSDAVCISSLLVLNRSLLARLNYAYPFRILFWEFLLLFLASAFIFSRTISGSRSRIKDVFKNRWLLASACAIAVSLHFMAQSLLRFEGLTVWTMLLPLLQLLTSQWLDLLSFRFSEWNRFRASKWPVALFTVIVAYGHYRLTKYALMSSVLGMVLFSAGEASLFAARESTRDHALPEQLLPLALCVAVAGIGALLSLVSTLLFESTSSLWSQTSSSAGIILVIGCVLFSWMLFSSLCPRQEQLNRHNGRTIETTSALFNRLTFTNSTLTLALVSTLTLALESAIFGTPVISSLQLTCYLASLAALFYDNVELPDLPDRFKWLLQILFKGTLCLSFAGSLFGLTSTSFTRAHSILPKVMPSLDKDYVNNLDFEIVIAVQGELHPKLLDAITDLVSLPTISPMSLGLRVYIKSDPSVASDLHTLMSPLFDQVTVSPLEDRGLESHSFLYHIVNSWYSLAKYTLFIPGVPFDPIGAIRRMEDYFNPTAPGTTGFLSLGPPGPLVSCTNPADLSNWSDPWHFLQIISKAANKQGEVCKRAMLTYGSQFVVSAARIRGVDPEIYTQLFNLLDATSMKSSAHIERNVLSSGSAETDSLESPAVSESIERVWGLIMQCNSRTIAQRCPSLMSGSRMGGSIEDCACLDP